MKVFISWSGNRSKAVAELLSDWIKCVLQATIPWVSTRDIDPGSLWFSEISGQLNETTVGIVCLTKENRSEPWILFEAGALAKGLSSSRVCTFLVDLEHDELGSPLGQFNHTWPNKESMWKLVRSLNLNLPDPLSDTILLRVFETYWTQFDDGFKKCLEVPSDEAASVPLTPDKMYGELLGGIRSIQSRLNRLETGTRPRGRSFANSARLDSMPNLLITPSVTDAIDIAKRALIVSNHSIRFAVSQLTDNGFDSEVAKDVVKVAVQQLATDSQSELPPGFSG